MNLKKRELLREKIEEISKEYDCSFPVLEPDYFDNAILGFDFEKGVRLVYSYDKIVQALMQEDDMNSEEAIEYVEYNTMRSLPYMGDFAPRIIHEY